MSAHRWRPLARLAIALVLVPAIAAPAHAAGLDSPAERSGPSRSTLPPGQDRRLALPDAADLTIEVPADRRDDVLGTGWETSEDRAWTLAGDAGGLHVLVADAADGYRWTTVATLAEPGFDTDRWIGNACVTASGEQLVVAYAPRGFTNEPALFTRGAFTAVVGLGTGTVTRLAARSSLEYFTPSCGHGDEALLTLSGGDEIDATRLVTVDAASGTVSTPIEVPGQVTSAVLSDAGVVAAAGATVVSIATDGAVTRLSRADSVPYDLSADSEGGVVYLDHAEGRAAVHRLDAADLTTPDPESEAPEIASGALTEIGLTATAAGEVLLTGEVTVEGELPGPVAVVDAPKDAQASVLGETTLVSLAEAPNVGAVDGVVDVTVPLSRVDLEVRGRESGEAQKLQVLAAAPDVDAEPGAAPDGAAPDGAARTDEGAPVDGAPLAATAAEATPAGGLAVSAAASAGDPHATLETERTCAVPRNDPANQALQPKPRQVEWAVNQAVKNVLTVQRPANWNGMGMGAYTPQGLFPPVPLGGGGEVPSQIMLGILAQESNLWQAPGYVLPGVSGSPLIGNYYGVKGTSDVESERWDIDWTKSDCGYGVAQVTDGMRRSDTGVTGGKTGLQQRAVALDFAANVAAGLQILQTKWNQTRAVGMTINDGNPARIENWFFAVWAYNSGFNPEALKNTGERNGAWGVGWLNNPANPSYPPDRSAFHEDVHDASHPQDWPYPERVMGFAAFPPALLESPGVYVGAYRAATWNGGDTMGPVNRREVKPPIYTFCTSANDCVPRTTHVDDEGYDWGSCAHLAPDGDFNGHCWFHSSATWKPTCDQTCGRPFLRFVAGYAYQSDGTAYPPNCSLTGLPAGALVVDDVPDSAPVLRPGCPRSFTNAGQFQLTFAGNGAGEYPSKIDFHQLGAGFGGHFWFGHARNARVREGTMKVTGTWTLDRSLDQWTRVLVHVPALGAHTQQATYDIDLGDGTRKTRVILQRTLANQWVSLGVFRVRGVPRVTLTTQTDNGDGPPVGGGEYVIKNEDVAFDAAAFVPLDKKPDHFVVALGDSYSSGEGGTLPGQVDYYKETDNNGDNPLVRNACHRSPHTWSRVAWLPDSLRTIGDRADSLDPTMDYHLLACSGAVTKNLLPTSRTVPSNTLPYDAWGNAGEGQHGELSQLDKGYLDENTTLVTLSIGGNDAAFSKVVSTCILEGVLDFPCKYTPSGFSTWEQTVPERIRTEVQASISTVLIQIHRLAPNAQVMLMGYPHLVTKTGCVPLLSGNDVEWLNHLSDELATHMGEAVDFANDDVGENFVTFMDPREEFEGEGICGEPETVHGIISLQSKTPGESSSPTVAVSQQSFHPKPDGYFHYGNVLAHALGSYP
jgi:hypothetical protein